MTPGIGCLGTRKCHYWKLDNQEKLVVPNDECIATWRARCFRNRSILLAKAYFRMINLVGVRGWIERGEALNNSWFIIIRSFKRIIPKWQDI